MDPSGGIDRLISLHGLPPRSLLYPLKPYYLGSGRVESIVSYISRLAAAHRVTPKNLHVRFLSWVAAGNLAKARKGAFYRNGHDGPQILCTVADETGALTSACSTATSMPGLDELSLHALKGAFISNRKEHVCHQCLAEAPYAPLVWSLVSVDACPVHKCVLQPRQSVGVGPASPASERSLAIAREAERVLAERKSIAWARDIVTRRVVALANYHSIPALRIMEAAGVRYPSAMLRVSVSKARWTFGEAHAVAELFQMTLLDMLRGQSFGIRPRVREPDEEIRQRARACLRELSGKVALTPACRRLNVVVARVRRLLPDECRAFEAAWQQAPARLLNALNEHTDASVPLSAFAKKNDTNRGTLHRLFPAESKAYDDRYVAYCRSLPPQHLSQQEKEAQIVHLYQRCHYSQQEISWALGVSTFLVERVVKKLRGRLKATMMVEFRKHVAAGWSDDEIASAVGLTKSTVAFYRARLDTRP